MSEPRSIASFEQLTSFLEASGVPHNVDVAAQIIELFTKVPSLPGNLYLRWERALPFVQLVQFMIEDVPIERLRDVETGMLLINNLLEAGQFGLDHDRRRIYSRFTVPVFGSEGVSSDALNQLATLVVKNARDFRDTFQAVLDGEPGERIVDLHTKLVQEQEAASKGGGDPAT